MDCTRREVDREVGVEGYTENHRGFTNVVDKLRKYRMFIQ